MKGQRDVGELPLNGPDHPAHLDWVAHAGRVAQQNLPDPQFVVTADDPKDLIDEHFSLVRTTKGHGHRPLERNPGLGRNIDDAPDLMERVRDGHADVGLVVRFRGRNEKADLVDPCPYGPLGPLRIGDDTLVPHPWDAVQAGHDLLRVAQLGDGLWMDERGRLDSLEAATRQPVDQPDLVFRLDPSVFGLESVAGTDLSDEDLRGQGDVRRVLSPSVWNVHRTKAR